MEDYSHYQKIPWLERQKKGWIRSFWKTIQMLVMKPQRFFYLLHMQKNNSGALIFFLCISIVSWMAVSFFTFFLRLLLAGQTSSLPFGAVFGVFIFCFMLVFLPLCSIAFLYIIAGVFHLFIRLFKGTGTFDDTFAVLCYCGVAQITNFIPVIGPLIGFVWMWILQVIGLKTAHEFTTGRALIVVLMPLFIFIFLVISFILFVLFVMMFLRMAG